MHLDFKNYEGSGEKSSGSATLLIPHLFYNMGEILPLEYKPELSCDVLKLFFVIGSPT